MIVLCYDEFVVTRRYKLLYVVLNLVQTQKKLYIQLQEVLMDTYKTQRSAIFRSFNPISTSRFAILQTTRYNAQNRIFFHKYVRYKTRGMRQVTSNSVTVP